MFVNVNDTGLEAWRRICEEQQELVPSCKLGKTEELMHPSFGLEAEWRARWLACECELARFSAKLGGVLTDDIKIAIT